jgi:hypothetical protein
VHSGVPGLVIDGRGAMLNFSDLRLGLSLPAIKPVALKNFTFAWRTSRPRSFRHHYGWRDTDHRVYPERQDRVATRRAIAKDDWRLMVPLIRIRKKEGPLLAPAEKEDVGGCTQHIGSPTPQLFGRQPPLGAQKTGDFQL